MIEKSHRVVRVFPPPDAQAIHHEDDRSIKDEEGGFSTGGHDVFDSWGPR